MPLIQWNKQYCFEIVSSYLIFNYVLQELMIGHQSFLLIELEKVESVRCTGMMCVFQSTKGMVGYQASILYLVG